MTRSRGRRTYKNIIPTYDSHRHRLNAMGHKMPQRMSGVHCAKCGFMPEKSQGLPTLTYRGKVYYVDFRLGELRNVGTAEPIKFTDIGGNINDPIRHKLRALRFKGYANEYIAGVDDVHGELMKGGKSWFSNLFKPLPKKDRDPDIQEIFDILTDKKNWKSKSKKKKGGKGLTKAQRYNKRLDNIFEQAREIPSSLNNYYWRKGKVVKRIK